MATTTKKQNSLKPSEQKTTAAFKLLSEQKKTLEKSLKKTQDELEQYRGKYHEADKEKAVQRSRNSTSALHEVLKFVISTVCGGVGVNMLGAGQYRDGIGVLALGIIFYAGIVLFDHNEK